MIYMHTRFRLPVPGLIRILRRHLRGATTLKSADTISIFVELHVSFIPPYVQDMHASQPCIGFQLPLPRTDIYLSICSRCQSSGFLHSHVQRQGYSSSFLESGKRGSCFSYIELQLQRAHLQKVRTIKKCR